MQKKIRKDGKSFAAISIGQRKKKKASACPVFLMETGPKNHTTEESVSLILHNSGTTPKQLTPLLAPGRIES